MTVLVPMGLKKEAVEGKDFSFSQTPGSLGSTQEDNIDHIDQDEFAALLEQAESLEKIDRSFEQEEGKKTFR